MLYLQSHDKNHVMMLKKYSEFYIEAGCDEAGRGCLCGPVVAASVIIDDKFDHKFINDSKKLTKNQRIEVENYIKENAVSYSVAEMSAKDIDTHNILQCSIHAMHLALDQLSVLPELILVDGNYFHPYNFIPHRCIIQGDAKYKSIAAASILAKNHRDRIMMKLHEEYPNYGWNINMGYAIKQHRDALKKFGSSPHHRKSFRLDYT